MTTIEKTKKGDGRQKKDYDKEKAKEEKDYEKKRLCRKIDEKWEKDYGNGNATTQQKWRLCFLISKRQGNKRDSTRTKKIDNGDHCAKKATMATATATPDAAREGNGNAATIRCKRSNIEIMTTATRRWLRQERWQWKHGDDVGGGDGGDAATMETAWTVWTAATATMKQLPFLAFP